MPRFNGPKEAAQLLSSLAPLEAKKIMAEIQKQDPKLLEQILAQLVRLEDLQFIAAKDLMDILKNFPFKYFCWVMRLAPKEVHEHLKKLLTKGMRQELEDILQGPALPKPQVMEKYQELMNLLLQKVQDGTLFLRPDDKNDPLV
jgi:flagellar motor switch protein FliG